MAKVTFAPYLDPAIGVVGKVGTLVHQTSRYGKPITRVLGNANQPNTLAQMNVRLGMRYSGNIIGKLSGDARTGVQNHIQVVAIDINTGATQTTYQYRNSSDTLIKEWNHFVMRHLSQAITKFTLTGDVSKLQNAYDNDWLGYVQADRDAWSAEATNRQWQSFILTGTTYSQEPYLSGFTPGFYMYFACIELFDKVGDVTTPAVGDPGTAATAPEWATFFFGA